ncbi:phage portal protein [Paracoccus sp. IB05]|uniref:phage portal protein n=1 Tax=Paracoccus sp. IB05 TaxID=2779367 RepID=UPI0018E8E002|nr:phage portal protein [Paracoccus sp. IB05]MBJ2149324.1 hypothetical protein [Paracoccus sp. IB05]
MIPAVRKSKAERIPPGPPDYASLELGPVTGFGQTRKLSAEIDQDRLTRIDRVMAGETEACFPDLRHEAAAPTRQFERSRRLRRLTKLKKMALATALTGTGIVPTARAKSKAARRFAKAWESCIGEADVDGRTDFNGLQSIIGHETIISGETFIQIRGGDDGLPYPPRRLTPGADKGFDAVAFVADRRQAARRAARCAETAISNVRRPYNATQGYALSIRQRKRIEEAPGRIRIVRGMAQTLCCGIERGRSRLILAMTARTLFRSPRWRAA